MKWLLILGALFCCISCKQDTTGRSFYYWKTGFEADESQTESLIRSMGINHFYIRIMDVDWSERLHMPVPVSPLNTDNIPVAMTRLDYTPVVFITNKSFLKTDETGCDSLAQKVARYVNRIMQQMRTTDSATGVRTSVEEIQIDCDWTATTKTKYFRFLRRLKEQFPNKQLSATIRLYPYKYPQKMGVPPVDKGILMCYNLGRIDHADTRNSVFDLEELQLYLRDKKYALPLDIALPLFGWYAWFRGPVFKGIIYDNELSINNPVFEKTGASTFRVRQDTELSNKYLREGDVLRSELPAEADLIKAAQLLKTKIPGIKSVAFFHWNEPVIHQYENTIQRIYRLF